MRTFTKGLSLAAAVLALSTAHVAGQTATVYDGGFEQGLSPWSPRGNFVLGTFTKPHGGRYFAAFGAGVGGNALLSASGSIEETVMIPTSSETALTYWIWITSDETDGAVHDTVTVQLRDLGGAVLETRVLSNLEKSADYQRHVITVSKYAGRSLRLSFTGTTNVGKATTFRIDDVAFAQVSNPMLTIAGTVSDLSNGAGIAGATITFAGFSATSGTSGAYSLTNVPCQVGTLTVSATGYQSYSQPAFAPNCFGGTNLRNITLAPRPTTLSGIVIDPWSGLPLVGVRVQFGTSSTITASNGVYGITLSNCAAGTLTAIVARYKIYAAPYTPACRADNVQNISLAPDLTSFTVIANEGATVTWNGQGPLTASRSYFAFAGVPCQTATLTVSLVGYETVSLPYKPLCDENSLVTITLQPKLTHFSGVVTVAGTPVPITSGTIEWNGIQVPLGNDGSYSFWGVPCTSAASLTVTADGYIRYRQPYAPSCDSDNVKNLSLAVAPNSRTYVCGVVTDRNTGLGVPKALLTLGTNTAYTANDGSYRLAAALCNSTSATLWTQATAYPTLGETLTPTCGKILMHDVSLPPWMVNGRGEDYVTQEPLPGVPVDWLSKTLISTWNGMYGFTGCGDGPVVITWPGYKPFQYSAVTCKIGIHTDFRYAGLQVAADRAALIVHSPLGGRVEYQGHLATPTESGYMLTNLPCNATGTLTVSSPRYEEEHLPYVTTCGTTDRRDVTLLQTRTFIYGAVLSGATRVSGATVTWRTYTTTTNDRGNYTFDNIPCGQTGTLTVTKAGYRDLSKPITATCPGYADGTVQITR